MYVLYSEKLTGGIRSFLMILLKYIFQPFFAEDLSLAALVDELNISRHWCQISLPMYC